MEASAPFAGRSFAGLSPPRCGVTTVVLVWLDANSTTAGMVFLVLVVWSATQAGIMLSIYIALLCALSFDYFFLPPSTRFGWSACSSGWR